MKIKKTPLSLYIHIPFCKKKCLYCDFLSAPACAGEKESYVKALLREISLMAEVCRDRYEVISVFFGGGTPSLLSEGQMKRLMSAIRKGYCLTEDAEITVECNPATADFKKLRSFRECGINRLSIGLQSANDNELKILGRIHNYKQFSDTFAAAREAGFSNINIDIMSALPGQTYESYLDTLNKLTALEPEHISAYSLIIEEGTPFYERYGKNQTDGDAQTMECAPMYPPLPDEDTERNMYHRTKTILEKAGFSRYEISNYARNGYECRQNLTYWTGIDYLGFGIGASSCFQGYRFKNDSDLAAYLEYFLNKDCFKAGAVNPGVYNAMPGLKKKSCPESGIFHDMHKEIQQLSLKEKMEEYMFLGLRLKKGISISEFQIRFHNPIDEVYGAVITELMRQHLLSRRKDRLFLTKKGTDLANYVMAQFLLE